MRIIYQVQEHKEGNLVTIWDEDNLDLLSMPLQKLDHIITKEFPNMPIMIETTAHCTQHACLTIKCIKESMQERE